MLTSRLTRNLNITPNLNNNADPSHTYVDMEVINNSSNYQPQPIIFQQTNLSNILDNSGDYFLSIVKWSFNANIPLIIPKMQIEPTPTAYNAKTMYYLNMGYGSSATSATFNNSNAEVVLFEPENLYESTPINMPISPDQINNNDFYYIYTVENFLRMVNKSLELVYNKMVSDYPALDWTKQLSPRFVWSEETGTITLLLTSFFIEGYATDQFYISFNTDLFNLFDTFPAVCLNFTNAPALGRNYIFNIVNNYAYNSYGYSPDDGSTFITIHRYSQQASSVPSWSPVSEILFTTNSIPIEPEYTGGGQYLGTNLKSSVSQQNASAVMTSFTIPLTTGVEYSKALLYYTPTSEYRLVDLIASGTPLNRLTMTVFWRDKLGFSHLITLKQGANATVKCLFRKKSFNGI